MWSQFLGMLIKNVLALFQDWIKAESEESAKWAAESRKSQLESLKSGLELEKTLRKAMEARVKASEQFFADDWAAGKTLLLCLALLPLTGCFRFHIYTKPYRAIPAPLPERPAFPADVDGDGVDDPASERELGVIRYAAIAESSYNKVRADIAKENAEAGYVDNSE